jgi:hypothetical protein
MIFAQVHTRHKSCVRYTLGARYLYFKRNAEKFGVRRVRAVGRKIRYIVVNTNKMYVVAKTNKIKLGVFLLFVSCKHISHLTDCVSTLFHFVHFQQHKFDLFLQHNPIFYNHRKIF